MANNLNAKDFVVRRIGWFILLFWIMTMVHAAEVPFTRGVNLTGWFQTPGPRRIPFTKFTQMDFVQIKSLGCDVIRLPIDLHAMTGGPPDYRIDPLLFYFLDQVVDWAEALDLHLILDNHSFDPFQTTDPSIGNILVPVWTQMAEHYRGRSRLIYYEILNEPHGLSDETWNAIQKQVVEAIRAVDPIHTIIVGPAEWNSYHHLRFMPDYGDDNLIYTFHFYDPFLFTHQGASWASPSLVPLAGVPFPYDPARMPDCPQELKGTWVESNLQYSYPSEGTVEWVRAMLDIPARFQEERGVPVYCGEFGVYIQNSPAEDRIFWYETVRKALEEKGIPWTIWDYTGGFGLFKPGSFEQFEYDLNTPLLEALGLTIPPQRTFVLRPDSTGFDIYTDYIGPRIQESSWTNEGTIDLYHEANAAEGRFSLFWTGSGQYGFIGFDFRPDKDLSSLVAAGYALALWIKCDDPNTRIDVRFVDTKTDEPEDHPWRMRYTINPIGGQWDDTWHRLVLPLSDFQEHGSWDNGWYPPRGDFDWKAVDRFEIVAEHHDLTGRSIWLDGIQICHPQTVRVENGDHHSITFSITAFPNPFNDHTTLQYTLPVSDRVRVSVWDITGRQIATLFEGIQPAGAHRLAFQTNGLASGVYVCRISTPGAQKTQTITLIK